MGDVDIMKTVFIAGPFRASTPWGVEINIRRAEYLALDVWRLGAAALCPHTNTRHFDGVLHDDVFLRGTTALMLQCDAVLMMDTWKDSTGAVNERATAIEHGMPVFYDLPTLRVWLVTEGDA
jgi:hypothetical protein